MLVNIFNSGCLIYPVEFTCFQNLIGALKNEARIMNDWYELNRQKLEQDQIIVVDNPENYIEGFNWVGNWFDEYFLTNV